MVEMFGGCTSFNSVLSNWDVSKVVDMRDMFSGCISFNSDLSRWNLKNVTRENTENMFKGCPLSRQLKKRPKCPKK